jgi:uncharacterized membrane protein YfcA
MFIVSGQLFHRITRAVSFAAVVVVTTLVLGGGTSCRPARAENGTEALAASADLAIRVTSLERQSESLESKMGYSGLAFLFGAFCALWAQNTGRRAWLWFFFGLFLNVIAVLFVLIRNSNDREAAAARAAAYPTT